MNSLLYSEMVQSMKHVATLNTELSVEERNLLSVAYKNVIGSRRAAWRTVSALEQKAHQGSKLELVKTYRRTIDRELQAICRDILQVLEKHLIPTASSGESQVFYYKMYVNIYLLIFCGTPMCIIVLLQAR